MKKPHATSIAAAIAAFAAFAAHADQQSRWQASGGSGDLATAANWSLGDATYWADTQGSGNYVVPTIRTISGPDTPMTLTASTDLTLATLYFHNYDTTFQEYILDPGANQTLLFNGNNEGAITFSLNGGNSTVVRFKSGRYGLRSGASGGKQSLRLVASGGGVTGIVESASARIDLDVVFRGTLGNMLCVTNGGTICGGLTVDGSGANIRDGMILVSGTDPLTGVPSVFNENNRGAIIFNNDNGGGETTMLVNDGGVVTNFYGSWGNRGSNARMVIDGGFYYGSSSGALALGNDRTKTGGIPTGWPTNNSVTVRDGGKFTMPSNMSLIIGRQGHDNWVSVESGGEMNVGNIYLGYESNTYQDDRNHGNRLSVSSGAHLIASSSIQCMTSSYGHEIDIGGTGTRVDVRNANGGIRLYGSNNVVRIHDGAVVTNTVTTVAYDSRLEVLSGAKLYQTGDIGQGTSVAGSNSLVRIEGGSVVLDNKGYAIGRTDMTSDRDWNNTLWVGDGGSLSALRLRIYGYGNEVVVSNGTLEASGEFNTIYGNTATDGGRTRVTFAGSRPRFLAGGPSANFRREAVIRFEIPRGGYETIPFVYVGGASVRTLTFSDDCTMEVDAEGYARNGGGTLTLMTSDQPISISAAQMTVFQNATPEGADLFLSEDGKALQIKVASKKSTIMLIR